MTAYVYPTAAELRVIAQDKMPRLIADRPAFQIFPMVERDTSLVMWEQKDNFVGLQQVRGYNGQPPSVKAVGSRLFQAKPGVYGEFMPIDELMLTERRKLGTFNVPVSIDDLVLERQDQLLGRRLDRVEWLIWTLLGTGTFAVAGPTGAVLHTDTYTLQTFSSVVPWATVATATPLADFRAVQLLGRGRSVNLGAGAVAYMNLVTANRMLGNTNDNDLGGQAGDDQMIVSITKANEVLSRAGLAQIVIYDEGYLNDAGTFVPFIADNKVIVIGRRPAGQTVGEYQLTRNANNPNLEPGAYMRVIDKGEDEVPRTVEVHDGHNGGLALFYPSAVVVMTVGS